MEGVELHKLPFKIVMVTMADGKAQDLLLFENLADKYFLLLPFITDRFSNEQQILGFSYPRFQTVMGGSLSFKILKIS